MESKELNRDIVLDKEIETLLKNKNNKIEIYEKELAKVMKEKKNREVKIEELLVSKNEIKLNFENL